ncbi:MAG: malate synthase A, partial [Chloroflexota bacterium]|nr:malate synthase A [Chloroflexota bacterium]
ERANQVGKLREEVQVASADLLDFRIPGGGVTEAGVRNNVSVAILYIESWLRGVGAAAIYNLMEDAATAEISRSQTWQWLKHGVQLGGGVTLTRDLVLRFEQEELEKIRQAVGEETYARGRFEEATRLFEQVALAEDFAEFLTLPAYEVLES